MNTTHVKLLSALSMTTLGVSAQAQGAEEATLNLGITDGGDSFVNTVTVLDADTTDFTALSTDADATFNRQRILNNRSGNPYDLSLTAGVFAYTSLTGFEIQSPKTFNQAISLSNVSIKLTGAEDDGDAGSMTGMRITHSPFSTVDGNVVHTPIIESYSGVKISLYDQSTNHREGATLTGFIDTNANIVALSNSDILINASKFDKYHLGFSFDQAEKELLESHEEEVQNAENAQNSGAEIIPDIHTSAETIVGMELASVSGNLSGSKIAILADSSDTGTVTGFKLTGQGSSAVARDVNGNSTVTYSQDVNIINTGGTTTGIRVMDTQARQIQTNSKIRAINTTGMHISRSTIQEVNINIEIRDSSNDAVGLLMDPYSNGQKNVTDLKTTIKIFNSFEGRDNNSALLRLETDDFVEFTGENHFAGVNTGLGMDIQLRKEDSQSGLINGMIEVSTVGVGDATQNTGGTYLPDGTTLGSYELRAMTVPRVVTRTDSDGKTTTTTLTHEWVMTNEPTGNYNKTNIGLHVNAIGTDYKRATLNFGEDAVIETYIGRGDDTSRGISSAYGDAINYETDTLVLNSQATDARVQNASNPTGAENLPNSAKFRGDISYSGKATETQLNLRSGNFEFASDYWYATRISFGDGKHAAGANKGTISQVKHLDSTELMASQLAYHVNSVDEHSILIIDDGHTVDLSSVKHVDITLDGSFTHGAGEEVVLIDGMIKDAGVGNTITFNIDFVGADGLDNGYTPEDFHIKYRGVSYAYEERIGGFAIQLGEASGEDLVLVMGRRGNEIIPEPSSVSLSILALTFLLKRRRRHRG